MSKIDELQDDISTVFNTKWVERDGTVVPTTEDIALSNGAVNLDAVYLYADLANSTELVRNFSKSLTAKVVRSYLSTMSRLIKNHDGSIRSFDGDRVMGIFIGGSKNSNATKCALKMNYVVKEILRPSAEQKYPSLVDKKFKINHCAGLASGKVMIVRGGVRGDNDLVSIGYAPNIAAKLSNIRTAYSTYITHHVYGMLSDETKYGGKNNENMWTKVNVSLANESWTCYKSSYWWKP